MIQPLHADMEELNKYIIKGNVDDTVLCLTQ